MCLIATVIRKYPVPIALACFALGGAAGVLGAWASGAPWKSARVVEIERIVEKPVVTVIEKIVEKPVAKRPAPRSWADLIVMQKNKPLGLDSDFGEFFVEETRKLPGVEQVSEVVVSNANTQDENGRVDNFQFLVQGWKPDNFGFEDAEITAGRRLADGDRHKVLLGRTLASNLNKSVGDKIFFVADPSTPYEVIGIMKSPVHIENGGAIVPFKDGQALTGKKVTGFSVRVKKSAADPAADIAEVRQKIESLRDPKDRTVRLEAVAPDGR